MAEISDLVMGIDIGGTFTDLVIYDGIAKKVIIKKILSTPERPEVGVLAGCAEILDENNLEPMEINSVVHGTTVATNAILEKKGAKVGLITTRGFKDVLEIGRELRYDLYDLFIKLPEPLVSRYLRKEVAERTDRKGAILKELNKRELLQIVRGLTTQQGMESIAICFLHSYVNPFNEELAAKAISDKFKGLSLSISSKVSCEIREYERTSTTVADAYVKPVVSSYLSKLEIGLKNMGYEGPLFAMLSNGGILTFEDAQEYPIRMIESGPAGGVLAACLFTRDLDNRNVISFDMGGTTAKICLTNEGVPFITKLFETGRVHRFKKGSGYPLCISSIELTEIGAGGGSIAWLDDLKLLKVGPQSAGAYPGPACYNSGGQEPTVTDADLVLGYINPEYFLGGKIKLDVDCSKKAIMAKVGEPLSMDLVSAAAGIFKIVNENMASAMRIHIAEKGEDPREYCIVAFGGAGPIHAHAIAKKLSINKIICPYGAGVASAIGFISATPTIDFAQTYISTLKKINFDRVNKIYEDIEKRGKQLLEAAGVKHSDIIYSRKADMRYIGQGYEISVPIPNGKINKASLTIIEESFWEIYQKLYGRIVDDAEVEGVNWKVEISGPIPTVCSDGIRKEQTQTEIKGVRKVFFPEICEFMETTIYDRYKIMQNMVYKGPAIIEENESTIVLGPDSSFYLERHFNNIVIDIG